MADLGQAAAWHRQIMALIVAADRAGVGQTELPVLRSRLLTQQTRFAEIAARVGAPLPALAPTPVEVAAAAAALGDLSAPAVGRSIQTATSTLDAVDAAIATTLAPSGTPGAAHPSVAAAWPSSAEVRPTGLAVPSPAQPAAPPPLPIAGPSSSRAGRDAAIYGIFALAVTAIQVLLFDLLDEQSTLLYASPVCLLVLPAFAWLAGWLTVGAVGSSPGRKRHARLGAIICAVPDLLLCAAVAVLATVHVVQR